MDLTLEKLHRQFLFHSFRMELEKLTLLKNAYLTNLEHIEFTIFNELIEALTMGNIMASPELTGLIMQYSNDKDNKELLGELTQYMVNNPADLLGPPNSVELLESYVECLIIQDEYA